MERSALALSEIGGMRTDEIADRLGAEPEVVRHSLLRARATIGVKLRDGRNGLATLLPFQGLFSSGAGTPALRAVGVVAVAVLGTGIAVSTVPAASEQLVRPAVQSDPLWPRSLTDQAPARAGVASTPIRVARPTVAAASAGSAPAASSSANVGRPAMSTRSPRPAAPGPSEILRDDMNDDVDAVPALPSDPSPGPSPDPEPAPPAAPSRAPAPSPAPAPGPAPEPPPAPLPAVAATTAEVLPEPPAPVVPPALPEPSSVDLPPSPLQLPQIPVPSS